ARNPAQDVSRTLRRPSGHATRGAPVLNHSSSRRVRMFTSTFVGLVVLSTGVGQCGRPVPAYPSPGVWGPGAGMRYVQRPVTVPSLNPYVPVVEKKDVPAKEKSLYERLGGEDAIK